MSKMPYVIVPNDGQYEYQIIRFEMSQSCV